MKISCTLDLSGGLDLLRDQNSLSFIDQGSDNFIIDLDGTCLGVISVVIEKIKHNFGGKLLPWRYLHYVGRQLYAVASVPGTREAASRSISLYLSYLWSVFGRKKHIAVSFMIGIWLVVWLNVAGAHSRK